jgi:hypothetical protein
MDYIVDSSHQRSSVFSSGRNVHCPRNTYYIYTSGALMRILFKELFFRQCSLNGGRFADPHGVVTVSQGHARWRRETPVSLNNVTS